MSQNFYHKRFLETFASENIIGLFSRYSGAAKEITESWAMLEAARRYAPHIDESLVVVVGDGCSPRTGSMLAYYTKADVISLDPQMNLEHWAEHCRKQAALGWPVQRMNVQRLIVEQMPPLDCGGAPLVELYPHSHAPMGLLKASNYAWRTVIAMPCCLPLPAKLMQEPHLVYDDPHVLSPKRTIHVWSYAQEGAESCVHAG